MINGRDGLQTGVVVDGYRIQEVLGRGGMGIVYRAEDVELSRFVALKVIDPGLARDETFVRRFRSEARALARVESPHIVDIHALRSTEAGMFIIMEYVDGGTLADLIDEGPLPLARALPIIRQMLVAFDDAHSVGVIHRDIKPRNIMISSAGTVKVTDFGLAKVHQSDGATTMTQGIAGTLFYMSPEQIRGVQNLDARTDLYALGMTMYEMLAGRLPFDRQAGEFAIMRAIVDERLPPPTRFRPDLPRELSDLVMRALEKDPNHRFASARDMLAVVDAYERKRQRAADAGHASGDDRSSGDERSAGDVRPRVAHRRRALLLAALLLAAAVGAGGYLWFAGSGSAPGVRQLTAAYPANRPLRDAPPDATLLDDEAVAQRTIDPALPGADSRTGGETDLGTEVPEPERRPAERSSTAPADEESRAQAPVPANVSIRAAEPSVQIRVAGQEAVGSGTFRLPPGRHRAVFTHPVHGTAEEPITVGAGEERTLTFHMAGTVSIPSPLLEDGSEGPWAAIWINGETREDWYTPKTIPLGPGTYRIALRKTGYEILNNDQQIRIEPGFNPQEYGLTFRMRKE